MAKRELIASYCSKADAQVTERVRGWALLDRYHRRAPRRRRPLKSHGPLADLEGVFILDTAVNGGD